MPVPASLDVLERLIEYPSVHTGGDYTAITDYVIGLLGPLGVNCHRLPDSTGTRAGLLASAGPSGPGGVLLSAHLDVVPAQGREWSVDPFRATLRQGRVYGRGSCDMKGFAACAVAATMRAATLPLVAPLKLALSYDEESGCVGIAEMAPELETKIGRPDLCLVGEPTGMRIANGHKGKVSFRVTFAGEAGHSSRAPNHVNALYLATDFIGLLRNLQSEIAEAGTRDPGYTIPYTTIHVGTLSAGTSLNIVPDHAELEFEIRHLASDNVCAHVRRIGGEADGLAAPLRPGHPATALFMEEINRYPGFDISEDSDAVSFVRAVGGRDPVMKVDYGTDGGILAEKLDLPVVVCGPGNIEQAHKADEFVEVSQLAACDHMLDEILIALSVGAPMPGADR